MATITKTVASLGADYPTWQAAEDSIAADPTDNYILKALLAESLGALLIVFSNASSITVVVHGDDVLVAGQPGHTLTISSSAGGATTYSAIVTTTVYRNLRIGRSDGNTSAVVCGIAGARNTFDRCEIFSDGSDGRLAFTGLSGNAGSIQKYFWCRFWMKNAGVNAGVDVVQNTGTSCALTMENCSVLLVDGTRRYLVGSSGSSHSAAINNVYAGGASGATLTGCFNGVTSGSKNGASDTTASDYDSIPAEDYFVSVSTPDLHCISRAKMDDYAGNDMSATAGSLDCDNQTVALGGDGWFMGADYVYPAAPTVDATPAPNASYIVGDAYNVDHAFTGTGTGTWDLSAGAVPSGCAAIVSGTGVVAGTLTTAEAVSYTARVTDAWSQTGTRVFTTTIAAAGGGTQAENVKRRGLTMGMNVQF